ncbi:hypothetical protein HPB49_010246 [Dermacentor silvarum]|uniref:Uncharacterized protein n=1 Tax=Dermacentor silvarum TaxID=543639 RepID=A0ACB8DC91_DERSI|nr:hypothetical protein HPB49_010246 [Dermacentor silvarum]
MALKTPGRSILPTRGALAGNMADPSAALAVDLSCVGLLPTSGRLREEQYGELQQLLQEVSDLAREHGYEPRTKPRKGNGTTGKQACHAPRTAAAELRVAQQLSDSAADSLLVTSPESQSGNGETSESRSPASQLLLGLYDQKEELPAPERVICHTSLREDNGPADDCTTQVSDDAEALGPQLQERQQVQRKRRYALAAPRGLRALQSLALEFLAKREEHEFLLRKEELALTKRRLEYDERRLMFEEEKHRCEEKKGSG